MSAKVGQNLHLKRNHPLSIIKQKVEAYCNEYASQKSQQPFQIFDSLSPIVTTKACFDDLLIPADHVGRKSTDTYYITDTTVLITDFILTTQSTWLVVTQNAHECTPMPDNEVRTRGIPMQRGRISARRCRRQSLPSIPSGDASAFFILCR